VSGLNYSLVSIFVFVLFAVVFLCALMGYFFIKNKKNKDGKGIVSINPDYHSNSLNIVSVIFFKAIAYYYYLLYRIRP
jgi:hypothetical protein